MKKKEYPDPWPMATAEQWAGKNPILPMGVIGIISNPDPSKIIIKVGDGHTPWNNLPSYPNVDALGENVIVQNHISAATIYSVLGYTPEAKVEATEDGAIITLVDKDGTTSVRLYGVTDAERAVWNAKYSLPAGGIPAEDLAEGVLQSVPDISTDIAADATSDTKTASPKAVKTFVEGKGYGTYSKPGGGIPKTDLVSEVQTSLGKADTAYQKPTNGIPATDLASGVIPDVSNFITKSVNDLTNYYLKSDTYTKTEVQSLIGAISQFHYEFAASTSAVTSPAANVLYLIGPTGSGADKYDEYVYSNSSWTKIGDTSIDLSGYVTTTALNTALSAYTTTTNLNTLLAAKQDVIDDLADIRSGASAGATAYQKPSTGIPASDMEAGVIPTVPTDVVKYTAQTLTDEQKAQARSNIGAGTYSKPSGGIPASDIAEGAMFVRGNNAIWSGTSITAAATAAKTASVSNFLSSDLAVGVMVVVTFSNTNTAAPNNLTLNIAARGAKPIKRWVNGGLADIDKPENLTGTMAFIYDGTNWVTWYESFDDVDGNCLDAKFGNVTLHQWKPDYTMTDGSYVKGADGLLYEYSGSKYVEVAVGDAERVRFLGIYPKYSSWTNGFAFGKYENDQWVTIESDKFDYDTSQDASYTKEYVKAVPPGATHFRTSCATSSLLALERNFYLYFQTGKPAVSQEELEDAVNPTIGTTQPSGGFLPNKVYDLGTLTGTVTFALAAPTDNTRPNPYHWTFDTGSTAPTVAWPANITWLEESAPTVEANRHYEILIRNGYGTALIFKIEQR